MANEIRVSGHTAGEANLHLQITPAYRRRVFANPMVRELTTMYILEKASAMRVNIPAIECGPDHMHLFITDWKCYAPAELARQLKGFSSYMMRKFHQPLIADQLWGKKFWSCGYFYRTVGAVNAETVKRYITEGQKKHWTEEADKQQQTLFSYAS